MASDDEKLKIELDEVNQKLIILESWLNSAKASESKLEDDLRDLSYSINETNSAIDDLDTRKDAIEDSILETSRSVEIQRRSADRNKLKLIQLIRAMQTFSKYCWGQSPWRIFTLLSNIKNIWWNTS